MKMMLLKPWFLLLAMPAIEGSLRLGKPQGFSVEERVMGKIQETCYGDNDFKDLIFILGDFNGVFDKASVIRLNNLLNVDEEYESHQLLSSGVTRVVMIEESPERLHSDLMSFKKTRWWNNMLPFFIIGKNDEKCGNFSEMLITTWRMTILNSVYICSESENTTLYTLNPITKYALDPWKRMEDVNDLDIHRQIFELHPPFFYMDWVHIYHQIFDPHTSCKNLNYDKTKVLNGYVIQSIFSSPPPDEMDESNWNHAFIPPYYLTKYIRRQLSASITFRVVYRDNPRHQFEETETDVIFYNWAPTGAIRGSLLFLVTEKQCVALVKFNEKTLLHKIRHLWSTQVLCASAISLIILYFILRMKNDEVTSAILDIMRFFICVSMRTDTRNNSFRIYFTTMLIFIVITNGIFQGEIAAFLMKSNEVSPIKTIEELNDLGYHFYVVRECERVVSELHLSESNVKLIDDISCREYVLNDTLVTCIAPFWQYEYMYKNLPEHLSYIRARVEIFHPYSWTSRRDWPIYERFNSMLMQIFESGIYMAEFFTDENDVFHLNRMEKETDKANDNELALAEIESPYRPLELANLNLAFKFLAIGLSFAICVLIVELRMREI